ncbi:MAG: selenium-dependent molybdenum cofactor biosynthesis protein YqeB [Anaerolineaceae bacterium]
MIVLIRGGGEVASGVALRLHRAGFRVAISELEKPLAKCRMVSFADAVYSNETTVEGITAKKVSDPSDSLRILQVFAKGIIPVLIDPQGDAIQFIHPTVVVDARMLEERVELDARRVTLFIGLGQGFEAGVNCHAAIGTNRGYQMGRVYWQGSPEVDAILSGYIGRSTDEYRLFAQADGVIETLAQIGDHLEAKQPVASVGGQVVNAPVKGVLRGLVHEGVAVQKGFEIGDVDPHDDVRVCSLLSERALAVGGGVLEAILSKAELRPHLWK